MTCVNSPSAPADECFYGIKKKTSCLWNIWHCSNTEQHAFTQTHWVYSSSLVHIPTPHTIQVLFSRSIVYIIVSQSFYASITSYLKKSVSSDYKLFGRVSISLVEAQWQIGYGVGLRIKRSSVRIRPWPLRWVLGQGSLLPLSQGEAFTLASISYLAILVKYILAKKKKKKKKKNFSVCRRWHMHDLSVNMPNTFFPLYVV